MKLIFMLVAAIGVTFSSCSAFKSEPIEPKIIGVGNVQYDAKYNFYYVVIDSMSYTVAQVTVPNDIFKFCDEEPTAGTKVTIFTSKYRPGVQAVKGVQSVSKIEDLFQNDTDTGLTIFTMAAYVLFCILIFFISFREARKLEKATQQIQ